jgi:hypothetical protein
MPFDATWKKLQAKLGGRSVIPPWSVAGNTRIKPFRIVKVAPEFIEIESSSAKNSMRVSKADLEFVYSQWAKYCAGDLDRSSLGAIHTSTYAISILRWLEVQVGGQLP